MQKLENIVNEYSGYIDLRTGEFIGNRRFYPFARTAYEVYQKIETNEGSDLDSYLLEHEKRYLTNREIREPDNHLVGVLDLSKYMGGNAAAINIYLNFKNPYTKRLSDLNITAIDPMRLQALGKDHILTYLSLLHEAVHARGVDTEEAYGIVRRYLVSKSDAIDDARLKQTYLQMAQVAKKMEAGYTGKNVNLRKGVPKQKGLVARVKEAFKPGYSLAYSTR